MIITTATKAPTKEDQAREVKSYDAASRKLLIDFQDKPGHPMDPAFCVGTLDVLPDNHLLVRKQTEPEKIKDLIENDPTGLVVEALKTFPNSATTGVELESLLASVIGPEKFKRWWTSAKKKLSSEPRVAVPAKRTEIFLVRDEPVNAEDELVVQFRNTRSPRRRLVVAAELLATAKKKELKELVGEFLREVATIVKDTAQLDAAERLQGAWLRNDLAAKAWLEDGGFKQALGKLGTFEHKAPGQP